MSVNSEPPRDRTAGAAVLVVEDDPALRMLCRVNLELEHYLVLEAASIERAEEIVRSEEVDVVLLDLHIGDRHGFELIPVIRQVRPRTAICLLSGTSETDPPQQEGVQAFIRKPFELDELLGTVRQLLAHQAV